jgi:hypothetical protein
MTRKTSRTMWQRHGYVFSALFGACLVALMLGGLRLTGIDPNSTAYDHPWWVSAALLLGGALCVIPAYYFSLAVSDALHSVLQYLRRVLGLGA